jgi:hypothetical protein
MVIDRMVGMNRIPPGDDEETSQMFVDPSKTPDWTSPE